MLLETYVYRIRVDPTDDVLASLFDPHGMSRGTTAKGRFLWNEATQTYDDIGLKRIMELHEAIRNGNISAEGMEELGEQLFQALFNKEVYHNFYNHYNECIQKRQLLRVELDVNEYDKIASWPWEFLRTPSASGYPPLWLATASSLAFARCIDAFPSSPVQLMPEEKVRILLVVATPSDQSVNKVTYEQIWEQISRYDAQVELVINPTLADIGEKLEAEKPHIFHFIGHARREEGDQRKMGQIALVNKIGRIEWVDAEKFAYRFNRYTPQIVILQACEGGASLEADIFTSVAAQVIKQRIPIVLAMQYEISNAIAKTFLERFYDHLMMRWDTVDQAVQEARRYLQDVNDRTKPYFAIPVLFINKNNPILPTLAKSKEHNATSILALPSEGDIPPPDAGFTRGGRPTPLYAFPLNGTFSHQTTFDLGMIWGLNRSSFIGLAAAKDENLIYDCLMRTERVLYDAYQAVQACNNVVMLPQRWWIKVNIEKYPNGPRDAYRVWQAAKIQDPRLQYIVTKGLPPGILPGIFITIPLLQQKEAKSRKKLQDWQREWQEKRNETINIVTDWCKSLLQDAFPHEQLAIVIQISEQDTKQTREFLHDLQVRLQELREKIQENFPIESIIPGAPAFDFDAPLADRDEELSHLPIFLRPDTQIPSGVCFYKWVESATVYANLNGDFADRSEKEKYRQIFQECTKIEGILPKDYQADSQEQPAWRVIEDLDHIALHAAADFDDLFLHFIAKYAPERIYSLIQAYAARSKRSEARRAALIFAVSSLLHDALLDAWVSGIKTDLTHFLSENDLYPRGKEPSFIEDLALSVVRQCKPAEASSIIQPFLHFLKPDVRVVCEDYFGKTADTAEKRPFFKDYDENLFTLVIRARSHTELPLAHIKRFLDVENTRAWALIMSSTPQLERIQGLLCLNRQQRAVLSLCTADEWKELCKDQGLVNTIIDSRHQRSLWYRD